MTGDFPRRRVDPGLSTSPAECSLAKIDFANKALRTKSGAKPVALPRLSFRGGDDGIRTHDPHVANVMLSQLSYIPTKVCAFAQGSSLPDFEAVVNRVL